MVTSQSFVARIAICNDHVRKALQHLTDRYLDDVKHELDRIVENLGDAQQRHESTVMVLGEQVANARQGVLTEHATSRSHQQQLSTCERTIFLRESTIKEQKSEIKRLRQTHAEAISERLQQHEQNEQNLTKTKLKLYQEGLAEGSWISDIILQGTSPRWPKFLSKSFKQAILRGDKHAVVSLLRSEPILARSPALHYAALAGDTDIAELLRAHGMDINGQCMMGSEENHGGTVYGVTPMHLAIGARNESVIRYLRRNNASFDPPVGPSGKKTTAPPFWLISEHWMNRSRNQDDIIGILNTIKSLGWDVRAKLNKDGSSMQDLAERNLGGRPELKQAVLEELQC